MSMIEQFFSVDYAGRNDLFEGLSIWKEEAWRKLQGTYPVISLSFANVKEKGYEQTLERVYQILADLYERNRFLLEKDALSERERKVFCGINPEMSEVTATAAIHRLCG